MSVTETRKIDFVWKKIKGRIFTDNFPASSGKEYYEEFPGTLVNPHSTEIWTSDIPTPAPGTTTEVVQYYSDLVLTEDLSVVDHRSWLACETPGDTSTRLKGWVPPRFHQTYTVRIYDNTGTEITTTHESDWFFDYENGVLVFEKDPTSFGLQLPIHLRGYRYIGNTLLDFDVRTTGINVYRWHLTEDDYRAADNHILFLRRDVLKNPANFKVYVGTTEHSFSFFNQRLYKQGTGLENYYTQHINIDDYTGVSSTPEDIYIEYTEVIGDYSNYNIRLTRTDSLKLNSKLIPKTISVPTYPVKYYYLSDLGDINDEHDWCSLVYTNFNDSTDTKIVEKTYASHVYIAEFPKNYNLSNDNLLLEVWGLRGNNRAIASKKSKEERGGLILVDAYTTNMYPLYRLRPGVYMFRLLNTNDWTVSRFFGKIKKSKIPIFATDPTVSVRDFKGFVYRTIAY